MGPCKRTFSHIITPHHMLVFQCWKKKEKKKKGLMSLRNMGYQMDLHVQFSYTGPIMTLLPSIPRSSIGPILRSLNLHSMLNWFYKNHNNNLVGLIVLLPLLHETHISILPPPVDAYTKKRWAPQTRPQLMNMQYAPARTLFKLVEPASLSWKESFQI